MMKIADQTLSRRAALALAGGGAACLLLSPSKLRAHSHEKGSLEIIHPWTFEQDKAGGDAIIGMEIRNRGKTVERLIAVEAFDAQGSEIRSAQSAGGKPVIEIPPGGRIDLHAKGPHVLLKGMKSILIADTSLPVTLLFEKAGVMRIDVTIEEKR